MHRYILMFERQLPVKIDFKLVTRFTINDESPYNVGENRICSDLVGWQKISSNKLIRV